MKNLLNTKPVVSPVFPVTLKDGVKSSKIKVNYSVNLENLLPFYLSPKRVENKSIISQLQSKYGITDGNRKVFKTNYIGTKRVTDFNGSLFSLSLEGNQVFLKVITDKEISKVIHWDIKDLTISLKRKNSNNSLITQKYVKKLISTGILQVKFNVSKIKDHGTLWRMISNPPHSPEIKVEKTTDKNLLKNLSKTLKSNPISELDPDDFFKDFC